MNVPSDQITLIIPAAGSPTNPISKLNKISCDGLLSINGKSVFSWTIDNAFAQGIKKCVVLTTADAYEAVKKHFETIYKNKEQNILVEKITCRSLGEAVLKGLQKSTTAANLIVLGDTVFVGKVEPANQNWITYRTDYAFQKRWCRMAFSEEKLITAYFDKTPSDKEIDNVVSGVYFLTDRLIEKELVDADFDFYNALLHLPCYAKESSVVFDCGNLDTFHQSKLELLRFRAFNHFSYDPLAGVLIKKSKNKKKIQAEVNWFKKIPQHLQIFAPRLLETGFEQSIVDAKEDEQAYALEHYGYSTLQDYYLSGMLETDFWKSVFTKLFAILSEFHKHKKEASLSDLEIMYVQKTLDRLQEAQKNPELKKLFSYPSFVLNGKKYSGFFVLQEDLFKRVKEYSERVNEFSIIHGDPCFSNILFDVHSSITKLIDPRGEFGSQDVYGDKNYDFAKLRHSVVGQYDAIVSDTFTLAKKENVFDLSYVHVNEELAVLFDTFLKKYAPLADIKLIEGLLFLSMIPLHYDSIDRQYAMYLTGIKTVSEVLYEDSN